MDLVVILLTVIPAAAVIIYLRPKSSPEPETPALHPEWRPERHQRATELSQHITFPSPHTFTRLVLERLPATHPHVLDCIQKAVADIYTKELPKVPPYPDHLFIPDHMSDIGEAGTAVINAYLFHMAIALRRLEQPQRFLKELEDVLALCLSNFINSLALPETPSPEIFSVPYNPPRPLTSLNALVPPAPNPDDHPLLFMWVEPSPYVTPRGPTTWHNSYDLILCRSPFRDYMRFALDFTVPLPIPQHRWFEGTWIVAAQGRGKTNLLRHLALNLPQDACFIFMDAKGEFIDSFSHLEDYQDRLVLLEPDSQYPLAINPLDIGGHSVELLEYIFSALLQTEMTPNQSTLFRLVLQLCTKIPNATLETFREIMQHGWKKYEKEMRTLKKRDQDFFDFEWDTDLYKKRRPEVLSRLRTLMASPSLDEILSSPTTKLDMGQLMDAGKVICISNNYELLGEQGSEFFGRLFIALIWSAARRRTRLPEHQKRPVYFFIDEAHFAIARDPNVATIIDQCRAQKIAMIFAHQRVDQIKDDDVKSALTNCAIKFANSSGDAPELAARLGGDATPEFVRAQKRGQFACHVLDTTDTAVSVTVPLVDMAQYPKMTDAEFSAVQARSRAQFCQNFQDDPAEQDRDPHNPPSQPRNDDTWYWDITISPKKAINGGKQSVQILADPSGQKKSVNVTIPPGTVDGARFRLKGAGIFRRDGTRGDIVLTIKVPTMAQHSQVVMYGDISDPDEIG